MSKNILNAILIGLLSIVMVACGAAGADPVEGEPGFEEDLGAEDGGTGEHDDEGNFDDEEEIDDDEENVDDNEEIVDDEVEPGIDGPFCGDGFVDHDEACDDGNDADGDGCSSLCEVEPFAGEAGGDIAIDLIVDDLNSNAAPLEASCADVIALTVNEDVLVGEGRCFLPANFLDYTVDATVDESGEVTGDITIVLNNRPNVLPLTGTLQDGTLALAFDGVTILVGSIRGVWDGTITADFD